MPCCSQCGAGHLVDELKIDSCIPHKVYYRLQGISSHRKNEKIQRLKLEGFCVHFTLRVKGVMAGNLSSHPEGKPNWGQLNY